MWAVVEAKVRFRKNKDDADSKERCILLVSSDMSNVNGITEYFRKGWKRLLKDEGIAINESEA